MLFRLWGQSSIGPSAVDDQSNNLMSDAVRPGPFKKLCAAESGLELGVPLK
jgi:hypothetical protein